MFKDNIFITKGKICQILYRGNIWWKDCFVAWDKELNLYVYEENIRQAFNDLLFKSCERNSEQYKTLSLESVLSLDEAVICYRVITGTCSMGTENFLTSIIGEKNIKENYTIQEIINLTTNQYNSQEFKKFFK